jgi:hypothetical protein
MMPYTGHFAGTRLLSFHFILHLLVTKPKQFKKKKN